MLGPDLTGPTVRQSPFPEARGVERQRDPAGREQASPGLQAVTGYVLGERQERSQPGHRAGAGIAELTVVERQLKAAGVQGCDAARRGEHAAAPAARQLDRQPVRLDDHVAPATSATTRTATSTPAPVHTARSPPPASRPWSATS